MRIPTINAGNKNAMLKNRFRNLSLHTPYALISAAHNGVSPKVFYDLAEVVQMPETKLASLLNLSARTISNYKEQRKKLEPVHSEHLLKLVALFQKGEELFGTIDQFNQWLQKPFWNSEDIPFHWLITPGGIDWLMQEMDRLAEGYPV